MSYYEDVYLKRLNRYGLDYQTRTQGARERVFEDLLRKSIYRVDFLYKDEIVPGLLEKYKQDETQTLQYLLTRIDTELPTGTILDIPNKNYKYGDAATDENHTSWLVYYLENMKASGYNRYILLKTTHTLRWKGAEDGVIRSAKAYFYGPENSSIKDTLESSSNFIYNEDSNNSFFITTINENINKDDYIEVVVKTLDGTEMVRAYRVTGYDFISTPGIEYVTVDPIYIKGRETFSTETSSEETPTEATSYWLKGGV